MKKHKFIMGVDVSKNTLDLYCTKINEHLQIQNGTAGLGHCVMMVTSVFVTSGNASIGMFRNVMMPPINKTRVAKRIKYFRFNEKAIIDLRIFNMEKVLLLKN